MRFQVSAIGLACITLLSACGGGGGGGNGGGASGSKFQSVDFPYPGARYLATAPAALVATASSELPVTFASNTPQTCTVADGKLVPVKPGECSVTATQTGDATYASASSQQLFKVLKHVQAIAFESPGFQAINGKPSALAATSDSGLAVSLASITPEVCTVSGAALTLVSKGQCAITASQEGNNDYAPALPVMVAFTVGDAPPPVLTLLSGYASATATKEGGTLSTFAGSNIDGWWCSDPNWCASTVGAGGDSLSFQYLIQTKDPKHVNNDGWIGGYAGLEFLAPGVGSISTTGNTMTGPQVDKQTTLKFNLGQNAEWFSGAGKDMKVTLVLGHFANKPSNNNSACNVALNTTFTPKSAAVQKYELQLASFTAFGDSCDLAGLNPAKELASYPVVKVKIEAAQINTTVLSPSAASPTYPTVITLSGGITLQ
ncbi:hypothetical protein [Pseudoduganella namucuonensis]|uniref:Uncharacterized protein n=1 Tax=Pseudoduganella namucuonensis TaxID=1035707 RepID=A0A1I7LUG2_9BURK|nr:hypothetical protein [Pseudoduganella namucuonensis]SFV13325.1 hypothetical protein SAMN05216552_103830 [Pseudoduganella namucuonensis]